MSLLMPQNHTQQLTNNNLGLTAFITLTVILLLLGVYHQTVWSMVETWYRSDTYAHGFLILPFTVYMIWIRRHSLSKLQHQTNGWALLGLCLLGFFWLMAELASVQVLAQYVLVAMIPLIVAAVMGRQIFIATAFPLAYLFFAVPFGDILIPPLIDFTADFTVSALQLTGIPVYREGTFFSLPTGNWSVVEACSGLRYLIASVTLGTLYAYLTYRSLNRRLVFIAFSIIVPIIANGIRAYLIVMTGHLSDMRLAVGVDHLIYGWVFFGIVMLLLFWVGSFWREDEENDAVDNKKNGEDVDVPHEMKDTSIKKNVLMAGAVLVVTLMWPVYATFLQNDSAYNIDSDTVINISEQKWRVSAQQISDWEPIYIGAPIKFRKDYQNNDQIVSLFLTYYYNQQQGQELINSGNVMAPEQDSPWRIIGKSQYDINIASRVISIRQDLLSSYATNLVVWRWYWLDGESTSSPYISKAILAKNKLLGDRDVGAEIIIAAPYQANPDEAAPALKQFLADMLPAIEDGLNNVATP
ncbi:MAG: exosortase A [Betaproteobacteria bacterium]|nr:exosortase A [Betaproteobacteria bacterium]